MREALARTDHDFVLAAPRRPARAQPKKSEPGFVGKALRAMGHNPGRTLATVVFLGLFTGIAVNALYLQTGRHPAPIFSAPVITRPTVPMAAPVHRPAEKAPAPQAAAPVSNTLAASAPVAAAPPAATAKEPVASAPKSDMIGALLATGSVPQQQASDNSARVIAAQKALIKLGYALKSDGMMGAGTKKAVESFESTRRIPVTGELNPRTLRELAAASGIAIP